MPLFPMDQQHAVTDKTQLHWVRGLWLWYKWYRPVQVGKKLY